MLSLSSGDGLLDLAVANYNQPNALYRNDGSGGFTRLTTGAVATDTDYSHGLAFGDFDGACLMLQARPRRVMCSRGVW